MFSGTRALTAGYRFLRWALITVEGTVAAAGRSGLGLIFLLGDTICFARLRRLVLSNAYLLLQED